MNTCYNCGRDDLISLPFVSGDPSFCYRCVDKYGQPLLEEMYRANQDMEATGENASTNYEEASRAKRDEIFRSMW